MASVAFFPKMNFLAIAVVLKRAVSRGRLAQNLLTKGANVAVRIRMKMLGRKHRPFFRIVAIDSRQPRNGELEELGTYDPMVQDKENRVRLNPERIKYWQSVGAKVSEKVTALLAIHEEVRGSRREAAALPSETPPAETPPAEVPFG